MKQVLGLGGGVLSSAAVMLLAQSPIMAMTQVQDIQLTQANGEVNLVLTTAGGERPEVFVIRRGNDFIADIINTQLTTSQQSFQENNPIPGVSSIVVTQLDPSSIRVIVTGAGGQPEARIVQGPGGSIVIAMGTGGGVAQAPTPVAPPPAPGNQNVLVPNPDVSVSNPALPPGSNEVILPDTGLGAPGSAPGVNAPPVNSAPPFLPRAVAPPLGDIAVSNVNPAVSSIDLGTEEVIPRLVLRDAPVRDVLSLLGRVAGVNVAYSTLEKEDDSGRFVQSEAEDNRTISLDIENERVEDVFNYVLRLTALRANRVGNTVFVGAELPDSARDLVVRTLRLNQVEAETAASFLSTQGAETQLTIERIQIQQVGQGFDQREVEIRTPDIIALGAREGIGPLVLRGISVSTNDRLNTITLVGEPRKVEIAMAMLSQLDLRQRQVAVNVKVIDVNLDGEATQNTSFSFGINDAFFVNDGGAASLNFGGVNPPNRSTATNGINARPIIPNNPVGGEEPFFDRDGTTRTPLTAPGGGIGLRPISPVTSQTERVGISEYDPFERDLETGALDTLGEVEFSTFPLFQYPRRFLSTLQAQIVSRNAKILTDPTLIVQEGEEAEVRLVENIVKAVEVETTDTVGGPRSDRNPTFEDVGLILNVEVERIDDNGFVTLRVNPTVSALGDRVETGDDDGFATETLVRSLNSGRIRLRDGQTLIVSGIIQEQDRVVASKIPILGDLPIIGALFRSTSRENERAEVIVLVTPSIMDDSDNSPYGYDYNVSPDARQYLERR
ncbi:MAG: AMIN domain-containing protein [Microcoleaceae cyanobacterium]